MTRDNHIVSVIIPAWRRETLSLCLDSLKNQTRPADEVITITNRKSAEARNEGYRRAHGDLIAMIDDDVVAPPDWLASLICAIDDYEADVAGGTYQETDPLLHAIRSRRQFPDEVAIDTSGRWVGNSGNILFRRSVLDAQLAETGYLFNENMVSAYDWELIWRLRRKNARMVYVPGPARHLRKTSLLRHCRHTFARGVGIAQFFILQRSSGSDVIVQDSLLWGADGRKRSPRWGAAFWNKIIGPFCIADFAEKRHFWAFWLGEKFQAAGFLWGLFTPVSSFRSTQKARIQQDGQDSQDHLIGISS